MDINMPGEKLLLKMEDMEFSVVADSAESGGDILINGESLPFTLEKIGENTVSLILNGKSFLFNFSRNETGYSLGWSGGEVHLEIEDERARLLKKFLGAAAAGKSKTRVKAPMPGLVVKLLTQVGAKVKKGEPLVVVEAMKMENEIGAPSAGTVTEIKVKEKQAVEKNEVMLVLDAG